MTVGPAAAKSLETRISRPTCDTFFKDLRQSQALNLPNITYLVIMPSSKGKPTDPKLREEIKESRSSICTKQ